jgi:hypothetical protein
MHPMALIAEYHALAATIVQCPAVDGLLAALQVPLWRSLSLTFLALLDTIGSWVGLGPIYVTTANTGNNKLAMLSAPFLFIGQISGLSEASSRTLLSTLSMIPW